MAPHDHTQDGPQVGDVAMLFRVANPEHNSAPAIVTQHAVLAALRLAGLLPSTDLARDRRDVAEFQERCGTLGRPQVRRLGHSGWNA